jgi:hypothetical protein
VKLADYVALLHAGTPFALSRWGDGEWAAILGDSGATCDGQPYTPQLRAALAAVLESRPSYFLGLQPFAMRRRGAEIQGWLDQRGLAPAWVDADVFARASREGQLEPLIAALRDCSVALVGPHYLEQGFEEPEDPHAKLIVVPALDAFGALAPTLAAIEQAIEGGADVIGVSAGPAAKLIVHEVHRAHPDVTVVDFGSLWEPYLGRCTRTYHRAVLERLRGRR